VKYNNSLIAREDTSRSGFTMIEILVSVGIAAIGFMGLMTLHSHSIKQQHFLEFKSKTLTLKSQLVDFLSSNSQIVNSASSHTIGKYCFPEDRQNIPPPPPQGFPICDGNIGLDFEVGVLGTIGNKEYGLSSIVGTKENPRFFSCDLLEQKQTCGIKVWAEYFPICLNATSCIPPAVAVRVELHLDYDFSELYLKMFPQFALLKPLKATQIVTLTKNSLINNDIKCPSEKVITGFDFTGNAICQNLLLAETGDAGDSPKGGIIPLNTGTCP